MKFKYIFQILVFFTFLPLVLIGQDKLKKKDKKLYIQNVQKGISSLELGDKILSVKYFDIADSILKSKTVKFEEAYLTNKIGFDTSFIHSCLHRISKTSDTLLLKNLCENYFSLTQRVYSSNEIKRYESFVKIGQMLDNKGSFYELIEKKYSSGLGFALENVCDANYSFFRQYIYLYAKANEKLGNYERSSNYMDTVLTCFKNSGDTLKCDYGFYLMKKAESLYFLNNIPLALEYFLKSKETLESTEVCKSSKDYLIALNNLGFFYDNLNRKQDARDIFKVLSEIYDVRNERNTPDGLFAYFKYGWLLFMMRQKEEAYKIFLNVEKAIKEDDNLFLTDVNKESSYYIGQMYMEQNNIELAKKYIGQYIDVNKQMRSDNSRSFYINLGVFYGTVNDSEKAVYYLKKSVDLTENSVGRYHLSTIEAKLSLARQLYQIDSFYNSAVLMDEVVKLQLDYLNHSNFFLSENELLQYIQITKASLDILLTSLQNFEDKQLLENALQYVLILKGNSLLKGVKIKKWVLEDQKLSKIYNESIKLKEKLANKLVKEDQNILDIQATKEELSVIERQLFETYNEILEKSSAVYFTEIHNNMGATDIMIEFVNMIDYKDLTRIRENIGAFIVTKGKSHPEFIQLYFRGPEIDSLFSGKDKDDFNAADNIYNSLNIGKMIWGPLAPFLKDKERLFLSYDGIFPPSLNISYLLFEENSRPSDKFEVVHTSSISKIPQLIHPLQNYFDAQTALLIGDIDYNATKNDTLRKINQSSSLLRGIGDFTKNNSGKTDLKWSNLVNSKEEIKIIGQILMKKNFKITQLTGDKAEENYFQKFVVSDSIQKSPDIIHFATHGFYLPTKGGKRATANRNLYSINNSPMLRSGLVLSGGNFWNDNIKTGVNENDGILTAEEVSYLSLNNTKLAVLSACETGLGQISSTEGIYGLKRAFTLAGVDKILISLWKIADYQTMELIGYFYENMLEKNMTPRVALKKAQDKMREKKYEPYYWAGFVLYE